MILRLVHCHFIGMEEDREEWGMIITHYVCRMSLVSFISWDNYICNEGISGCWCCCCCCFCWISQFALPNYRHRNSSDMRYESKFSLMRMDYSFHLINVYIVQSLRLELVSFEFSALTWKQNWNFIFAIEKYHAGMKRARCMQ